MGRMQKKNFDQTSRAEVGVKHSQETTLCENCSQLTRDNSMWKPSRVRNAPESDSSALTASLGWTPETVDKCRFRNPGGRTAKLASKALAVCLMHEISRPAACIRAPRWSPWLPLREPCVPGTPKPDDGCGCRSSANSKAGRQGPKVAIVAVVVASELPAVCPKR